MNTYVKTIFPWLLGLLLLFSCTNGTWEDKDEPPCPNEIIVLDENGDMDENYDGPQHMVMGVGMGGLAALDIAMDNPEIFGAAAALGGPADLKIQLAQIRARLADFDNWTEPPSREEYLSFMKDLFIALGNPCYVNLDSNLYPPGTTGAGGEIVNGFIDTQNPTGSSQVVTFTDSSGYVVDFLFALDLNSNNLRDEGEPILCQMEEPFTDQNGNGLYDAGEPYDDAGLDGVAGTGDTGEANGTFDANPFVADNWYYHDPAVRAASGQINVTSRFEGGLYVESGARDYWDFATQADALAGIVKTAYENVTAPEAAYCLDFSVGLYDGFVGHFPFPTDRIWFAEKSVRLFWEPREADEDTHTGDEATRIARFSDSLSFLSARLPNGVFGNDVEDSEAFYETHAFEAPSLGADVTVEYGVLLPAGYYDSRNKWKTYPLLLVLLDKGDTPNDMSKLVEAQGVLAANTFAQQVILVLLPGSRSAVDQEGYSFFMDQASEEYAGNYRTMITSDLFDHLTSKFRIKTRNPVE